jgi:hypothetical protein
MKEAFIGLMCVFVAIFLMFATIGKPSGESGDTSWSFGGTTLMDVWSNNADQKTERERIKQDSETQRVLIKESEATQRNKDFWTQFPQTVREIGVGVGVVLGSIGLVLLGWAAVVYARRPVPVRTTAIQPVTNYNYYQDATYYTYQQYNDEPPKVEKWDYANGFPPLPDDDRKYITVSRR